MSNDSEFVYGFSSPECDYILRHQIGLIQPRSIVDFGAGAGKVGKIAREVLEKNYKIEAVEGNDKTAQMLVREGQYHKVSNNLIQDWIEANSDHHDLAVFGDVLEHLSTAEINRVMQKSIKIFDHIIIHVPLHEIFPIVHERQLPLQVLRGQRRGGLGIVLPEPFGDQFLFPAHRLLNQLPAYLSCPRRFS